MSLAIWLLATAGSALILTQSSIMAPLRDWIAYLASDPHRCEHETGGTRCRLSAHAHGPHLMSLVAHSERRRARIAAVASKLVNCPMCSGFWLGLAWAMVLGAVPMALGRGLAILWTVGLALAHAFGGGIISALAVAAWILLQEAYQALALWRYNNSPRDGS